MTSLLPPSQDDQLAATTPLRILSLDGGGVRGYSMLIILQELMHLTHVNVHGRPPARHEIPKPCDHFDLIVGTGTGGLIALMLGRLRLDIETCKNVYVRMTKLVFETDKTIAGIPYRSTLFKASKLEEAIRSCIRDHTAYADEGNDEEDAPRKVTSPLSPTLSPCGTYPYRSASNASRYSQIGKISATPVRPLFPALEVGNENALLYDRRADKTKTAVTAVYKGTPRDGYSTGIFLRSYDSRKEPAPEFDCTIWQAGRATCATAVAFKPIRIGQSVFLDEGAGKYNPAPQALDEAVVNEWPGREVGIFVSIGTGIRRSPVGSKGHSGWDDFLAASSMSEFAEARARLIAKIQECETIHQAMVREHLGRRGVPIENYARFNVEIGVGEFGMNEWSRLADISTLTRRYLAREEVHAMAERAAAKLSSVKMAQLRREALEAQQQQQQQQQQVGYQPGFDPGSSVGRSSVDYPDGASHHGHSPGVGYTSIAVELPGSMPSPPPGPGPLPAATKNKPLPPGFPPGYSSDPIPVNPPVPPKTTVPSPIAPGIATLASASASAPNVGLPNRRQSQGSGDMAVPSGAAAAGGRSPGGRPPSSFVSGGTARASSIGSHRSGSEGPQYQYPQPYHQLSFQHQQQHQQVYQYRRPSDVGAGGAVRPGFGSGPSVFRNSSLGHRSTGSDGLTGSTAPTVFSGSGSPPPPLPPKTPKTAKPAGWLDRSDSHWRVVTEGERGAGGYPYGAGGGGGTGYCPATVAEEEDVSGSPPRVNYATKPELSP